MALNFATIFATSCLTLSVAIPGGLYVAGQVGGQLKGGSGAVSSIVKVAAGSSRGDFWVMTPAFALSDGKGGRYRVVAALAPASEGEGNRICKYLPIVRDRLQRFSGNVRVVGSEGGQPKLRGDKDSLANGLAQALRLSRPPKVRIVEARYPITQVLRTAPRQCSDGKLTE